MWLVIAVTGYFLNSLALLVDRALLSKAIPNPVSYTFFITSLSMVSLVLIPFGVFFIPSQLLLLSFLSGAFFTGALFTMFSALKAGEASEIAPFIGGIQPIFVFAFSAWLLQESLTQSQLIGFLIIISGGLLIASHKPGYGRRTFLIALASTILYAASFVTLKVVFESNVFPNPDNAFVNGFFWSRLGAFLTAALFLLKKSNLDAIKAQMHDKNQTAGTAFIGGQIAGALSFILVNYAYSLHSVTLVNSLQGVQYAFLFILVFPLSRAYPKLWPETWKRKILIIKLFSIILISVGLFYIAQA